MLRIDCPFCGPRDHSEFSYGHDASITYPALDAPMADWVAAVFERKNPCGRQLESWQHVQGCRQWVIVDRCTVSHQIFGTRAAHPGIDAALRAEKAR